MDALIGDPSKAKGLLDWSAKVQFDELAQIMVELDVRQLEDELSSHPGRGEDMTNAWGRWGDQKVACRAVDPEEFFGGDAQQSRVKSVCTGCPVREVCLAEALDNRIEFGVWGGMTARERGALLRHRNQEQPPAPPEPAALMGSPAPVSATASAGNGHSAASENLPDGPQRP